IEVGGKKITGLVDSGHISIIGASGYRTLAECLKPQSVRIGSRILQHEFLYMPDCPIPLIGRDILTKMQATLSFEKGGKNHTPEESDLKTALISAVPEVWAENDPVSLAIQAPPIVIRLKPGVVPQNLKQYPISQEAREGIYQHLQRLQNLGILKPVQSAWNTPLLPVKKPGTQNDYRPVQDLRAVNEAVEEMVPLVPNPYTLIGKIPGNSTVYSVVDLKDAYFSLPLHEATQPLFAFTWEDPYSGQKEQLTWCRLPQGFCHSPSLFSQQITKDLEPWQEEHGALLIYVDDLLLPRPDLQTCYKDTLSLLKELATLGYQASQKKAQMLGGRSSTRYWPTDA
uniref:ribonuclease H n=1 Tax=Salvator merianae TaxID=96440 RepID=A0A8D0BA04_SALMN